MRITDTQLRPTHSLQLATVPAAQGQHLSAEQPATTGQNTSMTYNQTRFNTAGRLRESENIWKGITGRGWCIIPGDYASMCWVEGRKTPWSGH